MKNLCLLGSTGSIGKQTIDIIKRHGGFKITSLAVRGKINELEQQIEEFKPQKVCVYDKDKAEILSKRLKNSSTEVLSGMEGLLEIAGDSSNDLTVTAMVGMIGIKPTLAAINAGSDVALANKETLVTAGHIIMKAVKDKKVKLFPIDSEHSAIFQCLQGKYGPNGDYSTWDGSPVVEKILLTCSGGPFRGLSYKELATKTKADALKHPNWDMGNKITIDSATLVNKALEVMEAKWLFSTDVDKIQVVIQPKSIIHSAVQFVDGSIVAQIGVPDMRLPIQYALYYPERVPLDCGRVDLFELAKIEFAKPDYDTFKGLKFGIEAAKQGGSICTVFNAANEYAVGRFLKDEIEFTQIYDIIEYCMANHKNIAEPTLDEILGAEEEAVSNSEIYISIKSK
ncbi:MAG: 1-deoxy-D-xylulose-5-phosphate reductoisomerase [Lachnospiraceae bacterium]|nr:1-deoxy-D-xylulose-5-phosphate reductoisomerase [Lachnospiraceae bacterium]